MFPAKIYVGQIAVVLGIVVASTWGATQWAAGALGYQAGLGSPWFTLLGYPVYLPWRLFEWWYAYEAYAPRSVDTPPDHPGSEEHACRQH